MPVVFEQPAPMAPDVSSAGGAAEQFSRDIGPLASLYSAAIHGSAQVASSANAAAGHVQAAMIGQTTAEEEAIARQQMQANAIEAGYTQQGLGFQYDAAMQNLRAQNQAGLMQLGMTQAQEMQLQQHKNNIGQIQAALANGLIGRDTAELMTARELGLMQPGLQLEQAAKAQQMQALTKAQSDAAAHGTTVESMRRQAAANDYAQGKGVFQGPDGNNYYVDDKGVPHPFGQTQDKAEADWRKAYQKAQSEAQRAVEAEVKRADKARVDQGLTGSAWTGEMRNEALKNDIRQRMEAQGLPATYDEFIGQQGQQQTPTQVAPVGPNGQQVQPQPAPQPGQEQLPTQPPQGIGYDAHPALPGSMIAQQPEWNDAFKQAVTSAQSKSPEEGQRIDIAAYNAKRYMKTYPNYAAIPAPRRPEFYNSIKTVSPYIPGLQKYFKVK